MPGTRWLTEEKNTLRHLLLDEHVPLPHIRINGRTDRAIHMEALRLHLIEVPTWSRKQKTHLRKLQRSGFSVKEIIDGNLLLPPPRSDSGIRSQWRRLKLTNRTRARHKKVWRPGELAQFYDHLRLVSATQTPEEIAKKWNLARSTVAQHQRKLGVKIPRAEVLLMEYSQKKLRRSAHVARRQMRAHAPARRHAWVQHLENLVPELRWRKHMVERTCSDCSRPWPLYPAFFAPREKKLRTGTSVYFKHRCRLCEADRRHTLQTARKVKKRSNLSFPHAR